MLKGAAIRANVTPFTSHALRRAFATEATESVSRAIAAIAGGWTSTRRMDDHYTQPSMTKVMRQLSAIPILSPSRTRAEEEQVLPHFGAVV